MKKKQYWRKNGRKTIWFRLLLLCLSLPAALYILVSGRADNKGNINGNVQVSTIQNPPTEEISQQIPLTEQSLSTEEQDMAEETNQLPQPGLKTIANLLMTAEQPVGHAMYVWGGGWNEEDTGAGVEAVSLGISSRWSEFAAAQDASYNYKNTLYQIHDGLDCSGYIGWVVYNVFQNQNGENGYVMKASKMAETFAEYGWGTCTPADEVTDWKPGDIMSMKGHVWLSLGMCKDGSVLLLHASPPGVRICGTVLSDGSKSEAVTLAESCMRTYYPDWYVKYPDCSENADYQNSSARMRWNQGTLADGEGLQNMSAAQVVAFLYDGEEMK